MSGDVDYPQGCLPILNSNNVTQQIERLRVSFRNFNKKTTYFESKLMPLKKLNMRNELFFDEKNVKRND